jgi:hypothetical protein
MPLTNPSSGGGGGGAPASVNTLWGPATSAIHGHNTGGIALATLNAAGISQAAIFMARHAGTLDRIGINVTTRTGTPPAYNVGFVTLDASYNPTLTADGSSAAQSVTFATTGMQWITLTTPLVVAAGQIACVRIWPGTTAPDASNFVTIAAYTSANQGMYLPASQTFNGTTWTKFAQPPCIGARYRVADGDDVASIGVGATAFNSPTFSSATTPDTIGAKFQLPTAMTCYGAQLHYLSSSAASTFTAQLLDASDAVLGSALCPAQLNWSGSVYGFTNMYWTPVPLSANTDYRLVMRATSTLTLRTVEYPSDAPSSAVHAEGTRWQHTERTSPAGAWTDTPTTMPCQGLWISSIT